MLGLRVGLRVGLVVGHAVGVADDQLGGHGVVTFVAGGTPDNGVGVINPAWPPGHRAGDIGLLLVQTDNEVATLSTPAGFTAQVTNSPQGTGVAAAIGSTRLTVFWCRATSAAQATPQVADSGDHQHARILVFRGCKPTGNPWNVTAGDVQAAADTSVENPGVTTTVQNCLIVAMCAHGIDAAGAQFSAWACAALAGVVEISDVGTAQGNGGGIGVATGKKVTPGATGTITATVASTAQARLTVALAPG